MRRYRIEVKDGDRWFNASKLGHKTLKAAIREAKRCGSGTRIFDFQAWLDNKEGIVGSGLNSSVDHRALSGRNDYIVFQVD